MGSVQAAVGSVSKIGDTVVDAEAMTLSDGMYGFAINGLSFQQDMITSFKGWQYVTYYNGAGRVCVARREFGGGWDVLELGDYMISTRGDAHNVISMGICPNDGTIHLAFDHHGNELNYRVSVKGAASEPGTIKWDGAVFGEVHSELVDGVSVRDVTYPRFWVTPGGDMQMGYRDGGSGNGDWYIVDYDGGSGTWSGRRQVINRSGNYSDSQGRSGSRNAYMNPVGYSKDGKLNLTWTWRESAGGANHDIMYAWSDDGGFVWCNNTGDKIADTRQGELIKFDTQGVTAVELDRAYGMINQQGQAVDGQGIVHTVMFHCGSMVKDRWGKIGERRYFHHWRDGEGEWHENELFYDVNNAASYVGQRPKIVVDADGDAYVIYQGWGAVNPDSTEIYVPEGDIVIQGASKESGWQDWRIVHVEKGPFISEAIVDVERFEDGVLSVVVQESPMRKGQATKLRVLDFKIGD